MIREKISKACLVIAAIAVVPGFGIPYALGLFVYLGGLMCIIALALGPNRYRLAGLIGLLLVAACLFEVIRRDAEDRRIHEALGKANEEYQAQRKANQALEDTAAGAPSPQR